MKIRYTKHATRKFIDLSKLGVVISKARILGILATPNKVDDVSDAPNVIASGRLNAEHVLRIVYHVEGDIITIVTFYPAKTGRYIV